MYKSVVWVGCVPIVVKDMGYKERNVNKDREKYSPWVDIAADKAYYSISVLESSVKLMISKF